MSIQIATPFIALGRSNGFPYCLDRIDVSTIDSSPLTLRQAMKVYWLLYEMKCTVSSQINAPFATNPFSLFTSLTNIPLVDARDFVNSGNSSSAVVLEPYKRICGTPYFIADNRYKLDQNPSLTAGIAVIDVRINPRIQRLYSGDVTNEDNFIGYGVQGASTSGAAATAFRIQALTGGFGGSQATTEIGSYMTARNPAVSGSHDDRKIILNIDGENIDFRMRQRVRLTGSSSSFSKTFTFTDSGCEGRSVYIQNGLPTDITFQEVKVNITGFDSYRFS